MYVAFLESLNFVVDTQAQCMIRFCFRIYSCILKLICIICFLYNFLFYTMQYGEDGDLRMTYQNKKARKKKQKGSMFDVRNCLRFVCNYLFMRPKSLLYIHAHTCMAHIITYISVLLDMGT